MTQDFVTAVKKMAMDNYNGGGDIIIECYSDDEIARDFKTLDEVKDFIGLQVENELNKRFGEDNDPELARYNHEWKG